MTSEPVTVIGAGIVGVSTAIHLLRRGQRVRLIDRNAPGDGTSFGNAGMLSAASVDPINMPGFWKQAPEKLLSPIGPLWMRWSYLPLMAGWMAGFLRYSSAKYTDRISLGLAALTSDCVEQHRALTSGTGAESWINVNPFLILFEDQTAYDRVEGIWRRRRKFGADFIPISGQALHDREPALSREIDFALEMGHSGFTTNPGELCKALGRYIESQGGEIIQAEVLDFEPGEHGPSGIVTNRGTYHTGKIVIAGGAWSARLAKKLGYLIPLEAERGYHVQFPDPGLEIAGPLLYPALGFGVTPINGGIRIAGHVEFGGLEAPPREKVHRALIRQAQHLFPGIQTEGATRWMGHRPTLPDSLPVIGRAPNHAAVYFAFGHQHVGLTSGPKTGRLVADLVTGNQPNLDMTAFRADRF